MITVGYGDIVPISNSEIIYVIFMTFVCNKKLFYSKKILKIFFYKNKKKY
jgi:hypothetical protein